MNDKVLETLQQLRPEITVADTNLVSSGILDSFDVMNLIIRLEGVFDIEIDPEDVLRDNFESVDTIAELILVLSEGKV